MLPHALGLLERLLSAAQAAAAADGGGACDVRGALEAQRRRVLAGVRLAFSRPPPAVAAPAGNGEHNGADAAADDAADADADPRAHPLWRLAEAFGAEAAEAPGPATTHVVATADGTGKVLWARDHGRFVVTPAWCAFAGCAFGRADVSL